MLETIIGAVIEKLKECGASPVYSAFNNISIERRGKGIFIVADICSFESSAPIYSLYTVYLPYRAEVEVRVTAPENYSAADIYRYYDRYIGTAVSGMSGLNGSLKGMTVRFDSNIRRLVLTAKVALSGIIRSERSVQ